MRVTPSFAVPNESVIPNSSGRHVTRLRWPSIARSGIQLNESGREMDQPRNVPNVAISPCAKLTMSVERKMKTSARAISANSAPVLNPLASWLKKTSILIAQVRAADRFVGDELVGRFGDDDSASLQHVPEVRYRERNLGVLLHQQDGHPVLLVDRLNDVKDIPHDQWREPKAGLVEAEELGPQHER